MTTRIGIIGANWTLKVHGSIWRAIPDVEVVAVCTAHRETAEEAARLFSIPRPYWDHREMAADPDIDIIDVGSRPSFRHEMVMAALHGGKHVYNALPFAMDVTQAQAQASLAAQAGRVGLVDSQFRWVPAAQQMKAMIDAGHLGKPLGFAMQLFMPLWQRDGFHFPACAFPEAGMAPYKWLADSASGGSAWRNFASHSTLLLSHMIGQVTAVSGTQATGVETWTLPDGTVLHPDTADLGCAVLEMENGAIGTLQTGWCKPDAEGLRLEIWGDQGRLLLVDPTFGDGLAARLYAGDTRPTDYGTGNGQWVDIPERHFVLPGLAAGRDSAHPFVVPMGWMFSDMLAAIREGRPASPSFAEALHAHKVVEAGCLSGREGRRIAIGA